MVLFYAVTGAMALATALMLVWPLIARHGGVEPGMPRDAQLYRDQLDEVERDLARGTINAGEAAGARADVSRRLIGATERAEAAGAPGPAPRLHSHLLTGIALIGAPALALALYLANGMPGQPDIPYAGRPAAGQEARPSQTEAEAAFTPIPAPPLSGEQQDYATMIARLETVMEQRPNDARGLELLASGYMRLGRYGEAWRAYEKLAVVTGDPAEAELHASMAEAMVLAAGGYVSPEAERALDQALARDPALAMARYYRGLLMAQNGRIDEAIATWKTLRVDSVLAEAASQNGASEGASDGLAGPSSADIEAAGALSKEERQEMIATMVARLDARLTTEGGEVEEWLRLMNAYAQLGQRDNAARIARGSGDGAIRRMSAPVHDDITALAGLPGPLIGLDLGTKTIGVAVSDGLRMTATALETVQRKKFTADAARLEEIITGRGITAVVLGLPRNMDGSEGPRCQSTRAFARNLAARITQPIAFWDERLSTVAAERALLEADSSRKRRSQVIDKVAAAYILQGALDRLAALRDAEPRHGEPRHGETREHR
jgi:cytochrome c-type biogenesis protein CcmH